MQIAHDPGALDAMRKRYKDYNVNTRVPAHLKNNGGGAVVKSKALRLNLRSTATAG